MTNFRGADLLVQTLCRAGVTRIFSLSGNQIMPIYDACFAEGIEIIHTRHEAAAVFMADAHAQLTGEIGVCLVTAGPGASNAIGALFTARHSESPVLLLTGDSATTQDGRGAFQEMDQVPMTAPVTKLSFRARAAMDLGTDMARAIRTALSGRPGPVHVALPFDLLNADASGATLPAASALMRDQCALCPDRVQLLVETLTMAKRPLILTGPSLSQSRAAGALADLAKNLATPVVAMESPRGLRDPSLGQFAQVFAKADLIVCLGKTVDFTLGFGQPPACDPTARWIVLSPEQAERDRAHLNLGARLKMACATDPRDVLKALCTTPPRQPDAVPPARENWIAEVADRIAARSATPRQPKDEILPVDICTAVQRQIDATSAECVLIVDGGEFGQWCQSAITGDYRLINGPSGAIGGGLCYGIGAKKAMPEAVVIALMGDGTIGFHLGEFETALRADTPFVAVIGNDARWNAEHQIQLRDYGAERLIGCTLSGARYDLAVAGLGGHGEYVTDPADLDAALARAIASGKAACVNVAMTGLPAPSGAPNH